MKAKNYFLITFLLLSASVISFGQSGIKIRSGGAITVNGNLTITPDPNACGNPITDPRDGKTYNTVQIGTQCWMAQNINIGAKIPGTAEQTNNSIIEKYCFADDESFCNTYGGLYQWAEMVQYLNGASNGGTFSWDPVPTGNVQGICPQGWHIPSDDEWTTLTTFLGGEPIAGGKMKETGTTHWLSPNTNATNETGFTALPGGFRYYYGTFGYFESYGIWWSSTEFNQDLAWYRIMYYADGTVGRGFDSFYKVNGFSVRCLQD